LKDCIPSEKTKTLINQELVKSFIEADSISKTERDADFREAKVNNKLNNAINIGQKISKESMNDDNSLNTMIVAGAKGNYVNISQIVGFLGQQNIEGKRIPKIFGNRTLPHYSSVDSWKGDLDQIKQSFISRGFIISSFLTGLSPQEMFFHLAAGREGLIDTSQRTAQSGYIQRRIVKKLEDMKVSYLGYVVNANNNIIQFTYGNGLDPSKTVNINKVQSFINVKNLVDKLNNSVELKNI
jgi:DNA-directed RNA polymerase II subunit RPB1